MTDIVPTFEYKQLDRNFTVETWDYSLGLILHVAEGDGELFSWFNYTAPEPCSSHWWVGKGGERAQYLDPMNHISYAQAAGNSYYHSVESAGYAGQSLTIEQIDSLAVIYAWGMNRFNWPPQLANSPGERGLGIHSMGGPDWGGHACPGPIRAGQREAILRKAQSIASDGGMEDMLNDSDRAWLMTDPQIGGILGKISDIIDNSNKKGIRPYLERLITMEVATQAAIKALADARGVDSGPIVAAIKDAINKIDVRISAE